jgi:hypothetical protein
MIHMPTPSQTFRDRRQPCSAKLCLNGLRSLGPRLHDSSLVSRALCFFVANVPGAFSSRGTEIRRRQLDLLLRDLKEDWKGKEMWMWPDGGVGLEFEREGEKTGEGVLTR